MVDMRGLAGVPVPARPDPLCPYSGAFGLGRPFGLLDASQGVTTSEAVPFGLRCAVVAPAVEVGDLSAYGFDHDRQIGTVVGEDGVAVPLLRHTTGQTRTTTNPDGYRGPDSDTDQRED
ncbi:putative ATP-grasp-modified RiPP [Rhizomonospora bruguierae]|uniref:putative ATP-grasp-modified RiPP n=1 Tax=Rhizomonospora bruguierae TaxID=1581705 RepID=UPI0020BFE6C4|nr:putative ATP-grasp-modified RiPP [Micromonospora sp. NBRC 107566]